MMTAAAQRSQNRRSARACAEAAKPRKTEWGLFEWRADAQYWRAGAIKVYKTQGGAEKASARLLEDDRASSVVARPILD